MPCAHGSKEVRPPSGAGTCPVSERSSAARTWWAPTVSLCQGAPGWSTAAASAVGSLILGAVRAQSRSIRLVLNGSPGGEHSHVSRETWERPAVEAVLRPMCCILCCIRCAVHGVHRGSVDLLRLVVARFVRVGPGWCSRQPRSGGRSHSCFARYCSGKSRPRQVTAVPLGTAVCPLVLRCLPGQSCTQEHGLRKPG